jgi:hypothetical protein
MDVPKTLEEELVTKYTDGPHNPYKSMYISDTKTNKIHGDFKPLLSELHGATLVSDL